MKAATLNLQLYAGKEYFGLSPLDSSMASISQLKDGSLCINGLPEHFQLLDYEWEGVNYDTVNTGSTWNSSKTKVTGKNKLKTKGQNFSYDVSHQQEIQSRCKIWLKNLARGNEFCVGAYLDSRKEVSLSNILHTAQSIPEPAMQNIDPKETDAFLNKRKKAMIISTAIVFALAIIVLFALFAGSGHKKDEEPIVVEESSAVSSTAEEAPAGTISELSDFSYKVEDGKICIDHYIGKGSSIMLASSYEVDGETLPVDLSHAQPASINLKSVAFQDGITEINNAFFNNSSNVERIYLPASFTILYDDTLAYIDASLTDIYYAGSEDQWNQMFSTYDPGSISLKWEKGDAEGAGAAMANKLNNLIGHSLNLDNKIIHYQASLEDYSEAK